MVTRRSRRGGGCDRRGNDSDCWWLQRKRAEGLPHWPISRAGLCATARGHAAGRLVGLPWGAGGTGVRRWAQMGKGGADGGWRG